jgi:hypothetical protein
VTSILRFPVQFKPVKILSALFLLAGLSVKAQTSSDKIFNDYFTAPSIDQKKKAAKKIVSVDISFDEVFDRLEKGKSYSKNVRHGFFELKQDGVNLPPAALVLVPSDYTPDKKFALRVFLHGAVSNVDPEFIYHHSIDTLNPAYKKVQEITIYPSGWMWAPWWSNAQYENIMNLIWRIKQNYNVDENNIRLSGVSDGGTGSYFIANCDLTPWSCVMPYIGFEKLISSLNVRPLYSTNFRNSPFYIVNGGKDRLYPKKEVLPYLELFKRINPSAVVTMIDSAGHNLNWLPVLKDSIDQFARSHPRNPFPEELVWTTDSDKKYNRFRYVVINQLGNVKPGKMTDEFNQIEVDGRNVQVHKRDSVYGKIEVIAEKNIVKVKTTNVKKYILLISPSQFDLTKPIMVWTNDQKSFEGIVTEDVRTLLKWNVIDQDRTSLYAGELTIFVR